LVESRIEDFETDKKFDLVLSITALEHIENDVFTIHKCDYLSKPEGIQIHIIPSFWLLFLMFFHGYRQYTPKRIKSLFNQKQYRVYRLGGLFSFFLALFYITIPEVLFGISFRGLSLCPKLVGICNRLDRALPICSSLCVVVIRKGA